jgi:LCP family protein required for cell wall assembly
MKTIYKIGIIFLLLIILAVGGFLIFNHLVAPKPLPPVGQLSAEAPLVTLPARTPTTATSIQPACGGPAEMIVMILGIDENEQADAIRLARVDFVMKKIVLLSIPRDFWVPIPGFKEQGITENRINAAYGFGEYYKIKGGGMAAIANTIYYNYGIQVNHYVGFHFTQFASLIDKIGGIDIVLEKPVFDVGGDPYFAAGPHHFDGATAMSFVRIRETDTDIQRIDRQTQVLIEMLRKVRKNLNVAQMVSLGVEVIRDRAILTDVNLANMATLACLAGGMEEQDVSFVTIPGSMYTPFTTAQGANVRIPKPEVAAFIQNLMTGGTVQ